MNNVLQILKEHKQELMEKYPIKSLALFGSYSRGDYNENSDIDIMVELTEPAAMKFIQLSQDLEDIFQKKVDLVSKNGIKPRYMKFIEKDIQYA